MEITALAIHHRGGAPAQEKIELGELGPYEVEIKVRACSICHSDLSLIDDAWGISSYPLIPGHEIVGTVTAVGACVEEPVIGQTVGLGWQSGACHLCRECCEGKENLCTVAKERTCVGRAGGFAEKVRADHRFVFPLPAGLDPVRAAPLLCAGITVFSPLKRFVQATGRRIGIVGLGGLGHLAVRFSKAMGAHVSVFDPDPAKEEAAYALGADLFHPPFDLQKTRKGEPGLDLILVTTPADLDWPAWLDLLAVSGTLCLVGIPSKPLTVPADPLLDGQKTVTGSVIGSPADMRLMLSFAARHGILPTCEVLPMSRAAEGLQRMREGKARFRIVLEADWGS